MENFPLFAKAHFTEIVMSVLGIIATVVIYYLLKNKPETFGYTAKSPKKAYFLMIAPLALIGWGFFTVNNEGLSYPTGIAVHQNAVVVEGIVETIRHNTTNEDITYTEKHVKTILFDKTTGKEIKHLPGFEPLYCAGNSVLGSANFGYQIVDLSNGEVLDIMSEDDLKARAGARAGEKIYTIEFKPGAYYFDIRTVKDKNYGYDPILGKEATPETSTPFFKGYRNAKFESKKANLFLAEELCRTKDGITLVLSYEDLEKDYFMISAISPDGELLWTKRDSEISEKLGGHFETEGMGTNTVSDDKSFYFVTPAYLVSASLADGHLNWIVSL